MVKVAKIVTESSLKAKFFHLSRYWGIFVLVLTLKKKRKKLWIISFADHRDDSVWKKLNKYM